MEDKPGMKKVTFLIMAILFVSTFYLAFSILPENVRATTRYVGGIGPGNYTTIQSAINAADPGDTVYVYNGTYNELVTVYKPINLTGEDKYTTIIDGDGSDDVVWLFNTGWANITGFTIANGGPDRDIFIDAGIDVNYAENCSITNNIVTSNNLYGIRVYLSNNNIFVNNTVTLNTWEGFYLEDSNMNTIANNTISLNGLEGVHLEYSDVNTIANNTFTDNSLRDEDRSDIWLYQSVGNIISNNSVDTSSERVVRIRYSDKTTVVGNTIHSGGVAGFLVEMSNKVTIVSNTATHTGNGILLSSGTDNTVSSNTATRNGRGILLGGVTGNIIKDNTFSNNNMGVHFQGGSQWNSILNNTISSNNWGIYSDSSSHNDISNNIISSNGMKGIEFKSSTNNTIFGNTLWSTQDSIYLYGSSNNSVSGNSILNSSDGIDLSLSSNDNTISDNFIAYNTYGVHVYASTGNRVYHNSFVDNVDQAYDDSVNAWDDGYPSGGNYWSDYVGLDEFFGPNQDQPGSDEIGDTPYDILGGSNRDRYPLMNADPSHISVPLAPQDLNATKGNRTVTLTWSPPVFDGFSPVTNYRIYRGTTPGGKSFRKEIGNVLTHVDTGLINGQIYYYQVSAVNGVGEGPKSNEANATPESVPGPPAGLKALAQSEQVALTWFLPNDDGGYPVTNYRIFRGTTPGGEIFLDEIGIVPIYADTDLINGQTYYYQVSAVNRVGESGRSDEIDATPIAGPAIPSEPRDLLAFPGNQQATLAWDAPISNGGSAITNYRIYRGTTPGGKTLLTEIGNVLTHVDTGLTNGQTYYYQVSAVNGVGEGPLSNEANAAPSPGPMAPSPPRFLRAYPENMQATLMWSKPAYDGGSAITNYRIYRGIGPGGQIFLVEIGNVLEYIDTGLVNGQTYYYEVSAVNGVGEGARSNEVSATPSAGPSVLQIAEFQDSTSSGDVRIEIYNNGTRAVSTSEIYLSPDGITPWTGGTWSETYVSPGGHSVYQLGPGEAFASTEGGTINLHNITGSVFDSVSFGQAGSAPDPLNDESTSRYWNGNEHSNVWVRDVTSTFGTQNDIFGRLDLPPIILNEVYFNALSPDERFIEIHYPGTSSVNIVGWILVVDSQYVLPPVTLNATSSYFVLRGNDFPGSFDMDDGWSNGDNVYLYDPLGRLVDMVGWSLPHTQGRSMSRFADQSQWGYDGFDDGSSIAAGWVFGTSTTPEIVSLAPDQFRVVEVGETSECDIYLNYSGSSDDVFDIHSVSDLGWPVSITDISGNPIVDHDGDARPDSDLMVPGDFKVFRVWVTAPIDSQVGEYDTVRVIAVSSVNANVRATMILLARAALLPHIAINKSAEPDTIWLEGTPMSPQETTVTLDLLGAGRPFIWFKPRDTVLVIDNTGSMVNNDPQNLRLLAAKTYVDMLEYPDRAATVRFTMTGELVNGTHLTTDYDQVKADIDSFPPADGSTSIPSGMVAATDELLGYGNPAHTLVEILLTDGANSVGDGDERTIMEAYRAAKNGIIIFTIGLLAGVNEPLLREVASITGGAYYAAPTAEALEDIFTRIYNFEDIANIAGSKIEGSIIPNPLIRDVLPPYIHFVPGSFRDQNSNPCPPDSITADPDGNAVLDWDINKILINQSLIVRFDVTSSAGGYVPVGVHPLSRVNYTKWDNSNDSVPFQEVFINVLKPEPVDHPVLNIETDQNDVHLSWTIPGPNITHYLIYRSTDQREFDFSTPFVDTSRDNDSGVIPTRTTWNDTGVASPVPQEYYYVVRAVNMFGSKSITSNTVGKWTKRFDAGLNTFSIPLEPIVERDIGWYANSIPGTVYINWMSDTGHWVRHWKGGPIGRLDPLGIGEGFEIYLSSPSDFTFVGSPASMIMFREGLGDSVDFRKGLTVTVLQGDVTLYWKPALGAGGYKIFRSDGRMGFHDILPDPLVTFNDPRIFWKDMGAMSQPGSWYYMVVPISPGGSEGSGTYSVGAATVEYHSGVNSFALPMKQLEVHSLDWYCSEISDVVGMAYLVFEVWKFHAKEMPEEVYDVEVLQSEGYQISVDGTTTRFTFVGY
jgi:parallel beta-helix repeat protein